MKKIDFKCTVCGYENKYDMSLESFKCSNCHTEYDKSVFRFSKKQKTGVKFKKYGFLIAILSAFYLIYLIFRILVY